MPNYSLEVGDAFEKILSHMSAKRGIEKAEVIKRAVAFYAFIDSECDGATRKASITDQDDRVIKDIEIP